MTLTLHPLDPEHLPDGLSPAADLRGIALYWRDAAPPPAPATTTRRRSRKTTASSISSSSQKAARPWQTQRIAFHAVSPRQEDVPPKDAADAERYVLDAYALAASHHPIPSDAEILYEIRW